jgi:DNA-binding transcriptional LysR family regulator
MPASLSGERLIALEFVVVAAPDHPLASVKGTIAKSELVKHVQLVLTDRTTLSEGREFGVMSPQTWRLADLFAKHAFLLNGLGWGSMPVHAVERDIREGRLVELSIEDVTSGGLIMAMSAVYPTSAPPGPAGRWLIERLKQCSSQITAGAAAAFLDASGGRPSARRIGQTG